MARTDRKIQEPSLVRREQQIAARGLDEYPRFWRKVNREGECWIWTASKLPNGYGQLTANKKHGTAHRFCWTIVYGPIPKNYCVLHRCDNRACVRPSHLFLGTYKDNTLDRQLKWRTPRGASHYRATVTEKQVVAMRKLYDAGELAIRIAEKFNLEKRHAWLIVTRKRWKHIP